MARSKTEYRKPEDDPEHGAGKVTTARSSGTVARSADQAGASGSGQGDLDGLLAVLDPDAVVRIDGAARMAAGAADAADTPREIKGASNWARRLIAPSRGLRFVQPALIDGSVGLIVAPGGRLSRVLIFTFTSAKIARLEVVGEGARLRELEIAVL